MLVRREQIVAAARAVIEEHGPDALTGQIADRAGLARPNVYRHFASKDELDLAVARSAYEELLAEAQQRIDASDSPVDMVRAPIAVEVIWADRHPNLYRFLVSRGLFRQLASSGREQKRGQHPTGRRDFAVELVATGTRAIPGFAENPEAAEAIVIGLTAFTQASILVWLARQSDPPDRLIDRITTQNWLIIDHHLREAGIQIDPAAPISQPVEARS
jgi:AcrR family transcriptional regulator